MDFNIPLERWLHDLFIYCQYCTHFLLFTLWVRVTVRVKAKFHYTSWFGAGSEPASVMEFGR